MRGTLRRGWRKSGTNASTTCLFRQSRLKQFFQTCPRRGMCRVAGEVCELSRIGAQVVELKPVRCVLAPLGVAEIFGVDGPAPDLVAEQDAVCGAIARG